MASVIHRSRLFLIIFSAAVLISSCKKETEACFSTNRIASLPGKFVTFVNCSANSDSWLWDFGDGNTSTEAAPSHAYLTKGTYTVTMEARGEKGDVDNADLEIFVGDPGPIAVVVDSLRFPVSQASELEVILQGLPANSQRVTPFDLPIVLNMDPELVMTGTNYTIQIKTSLDDATLSFNPQTQIQGDYTLRISNPPYWSAYIGFTGR